MRPSEAAPDRGPVARLLHTLKNNPLGTFYLELRPRWEFADIDGDRNANALTLRTVAGLGTRSWKGLSLLVEGESVITVDSDWYFDGTGRSNGRSFVPDPPKTDLNQLYLDYESPWAGTSLRIGRQRMQLDDERFITPRDRCFALAAAVDAEA